MRHYVLKPEVAGGAGPNTIFIDPGARPPSISKFNYEFDGWLGDPILETVCSYIVTRTLSDSIAAIHPTGVSFGTVEVSKSGEFEDLYPARDLPEFVWLQVTGTPGQDDFGYTTSNGHCIVVSERILDLLLASGMAYGKFVELEDWKGRVADNLRRHK